MKPIRLLPPLLALLVAATVSAADGSGRPDSFRQGLRPVEPPVPAPDFTLKDMDGRAYRFSGRNGHVRIVNFWATWCPPCRREMPSMQRAWKQLAPEGVDLLAVNVGEDEDTVFEFMGQYPMDFPVLLDTEGKVVETWPVQALPTTFVVDPEGCIRYRAIGGRDWDDPGILEKVLALKTAPPVACGQVAGPESD